MGADGGSSTARRWVVFVAMYCAYMIYYFNKKNYAFFVPALLSETGLSKTQVGAMATTMEMVGAVTSFFNGVLIDTWSPKVLLAFMLCVAAMSNLLLCFTQSISVMVTLWGINGFAQAFGWPALTKIFMNWFHDPKERGKLYSILSTNQNVGSVLVPILLVPAMRYAESLDASIDSQESELLFIMDRLLGWRVSMSLPALVGLAYAAFIIIFIKDSPDEDDDEEEVMDPVTRIKSGGKKNDGPKESVIKSVLLNPVVWQLSICYFGIGVIRSFFGDWGAVFVAEKYYEDGRTSREVDTLIAACISSLELGGLIGTLAAGVISDKIFHGRRTPVIALFTLGLCPLCMMYVIAPEAVVKAWPYTAFFAFGCCFTAPHVLIGLAARELTGPTVASTAGGFVAAISKFGSSVAGAPLGAITQKYGWDGSLQVMCAICLAGGLAVLPLWNAVPPTPKDIKKQS